jgi:hypothetical protein
MGRLAAGLHLMHLMEDVNPLTEKKMKKSMMYVAFIIIKRGKKNQ